MTTTLHIEHPITEFDVWKSAFDGFAPMRASAGVRSHTVSRPVEDDRYIVVDLAFESTDAADSFLLILRERVWASPASSPGLAGLPITRILNVVEQA